MGNQCVDNTHSTILIWKVFGQIRKRMKKNPAMISLITDFKLNGLVVLCWARRMMTSPNGNILRVTGPLCGEFTDPGEFSTKRPVTRSFDVFFDLRVNKRLNKQPWGWWFDTLSWSLWRHCNGPPVKYNWSKKKKKTTTK